MNQPFLLGVGRTQTHRSLASLVPRDHCHPEYKQLNSMAFGQCYFRQNTDEKSINECLRIVPELRTVTTLTAVAIP